MDINTEEPKHTHLGIRVALAGVVVAVLIVGFVYVGKKDSIIFVEPAVVKGTEEEGVPTGVEPVPVSQEVPVQDTVSTLAYRDGAYTVVGKYSAPSGAENVGITLVLKDDVIVDASGTVETAHPTSKKFQGLFLGGFKTQVVGKKLSEVSLDKVSGSSLTPKGFADAVLQIRAEAGV